MILLQTTLTCHNHTVNKIIVVQKILKTVQVRTKKGNFRTENSQFSIEGHQGGQK